MLQTEDASHPLPSEGLFVLFQAALPDLHCDTGSDVIAVSHSGVATLALPGLHREGVMGAPPWRRPF